MEILLLCGNGYGVGTMKILRGMYELAVTARYLHAHPSEAKAFFDFHWVSQYKLAQAISETFGERTLTSEKIRQLKARRDEVREHFIVTVCKKCQATGLRIPGAGLISSQWRVRQVRSGSSSFLVITTLCFIPTAQRTRYPRA
jgi:hypothetical protein